MKEEHYFYVPEASSRTELPEEEARHAVKVLRLHPGDKIFITDGCDHIYEAVVTDVSRNGCCYKIISGEDVRPSWHGLLHLAIAPTKNIDRIEWMVEKCVEVGVDEISFVDCKCGLRHKLNMERLNRIVVSAMKQSHKARKVIMNDLVSFDSFIKSVSSEEEKFIAHCLGDNDVFKVRERYIAEALGEGSKTILIGPEGDFTLEEVAAAISAGFVPVSLGESRLRTETAGLYSVIIMNLKNSGKIG